ncbi:hypothetical protein FHR49_001363 [Xanthomonas campestris]
MRSEINRKILSIYFKGQISNGINDLRAYTEKIEQHLESNRYKIEEKSQRKDGKAKEDKGSEDLLFDVSLRLGYGRHIEIFTKSAIISIYTYLEFFLDDFCKKIHELEGKSISPKDLSGAGIFRSKAYLEKVLLVDWASLSSEWNELVKLNKIRNFLVHSNGVAATDETKSEIRKIIQGISEVELEGDHLKVSSGYIRNMLSVIEKALTEIEGQYAENTV